MTKIYFWESNNQKIQQKLKCMKRILIKETKKLAIFELKKTLNQENLFPMWGSKSHCPLRNP